MNTHFEMNALESRLLLSATLVKGTLTVTGTDANDSITVMRAAPKSKFLAVNINGQVSTFKASSVKHLVMIGGAGDDQLTITDTNGSVGGTHLENGGDGNDTLTGDAANDTLVGMAGDDSLDGGAGNDSLNGGDDNDTLTGGSGNDHLDGMAGDDSLDGGAGNDSLAGGDGNDTLTGDAGNDHLDGQAGNDDCDGGTGRDSVLGGTGTYHFHGADDSTKEIKDHGIDDTEDNNGGNAGHNSIVSAASPSLVHSLKSSKNVFAM